MKNHITAVIVLFIVGLLVFFGLLMYSWQRDAEPREQDLIEENPSETLGVVDTNNNSAQTGARGNMGEPSAGYEAYEDNNLGFGLWVPEDAKVEETAANAVEVTVLGPDNEEGTEIQDGLLLTVLRDPGGNAHDSLAAYAGEIYRQKSESTSGNMLTEPVQRTVGGKPAYYFRHESALGVETEEYIFLPELGAPGYRVSYVTAGSENQKASYESIASTMLGSLWFAAPVE